MKKLLGLAGRHRKNGHVLGVAVFVSLLIGVVPMARAQQGAGVRAGVSADPDQFFVGAHYVSAPIADRVRFQPNLEVGFGDDLTTVAVNIEFAYWARMNRDWQFYAGGGPALNVYDYEGNGDSDTEPGFNLLAGVRARQGVFFEFKVGLVDSPEIKFGVGYTF